MEYIISAYRFFGKIFIILKPGVLKELLAPSIQAYWPRHWLFSANSLSISRVFFFWSALIYTIYNELSLLDTVFVLGFAFACISDFLDGAVAFALKTESQVGGYLDQLSDKLTIVPLLVVLTMDLPWLFVLSWVICLMDLCSLVIKTIKLKMFLDECAKSSIKHNSPKYNSSSNDYGKYKMLLQCITLALLLLGANTSATWTLITAISLAGMSLYTQKNSLYIKKASA